MIRDITYDIILPIWKYKLWPLRISSIQSHSAMQYMKHDMSIDNFSLQAWFHGYYINDKLVGVNSGHLCVDGSARSRGLWVDPEYRRNGFGKTLLLGSIRRAIIEKCFMIWSFPRKSSWSTYKSVGFKLSSPWILRETNETNAYCYMDISKNVI